ncbi:NAD(P)/FAD-dependent oxidoreductase [Tissierella pigra]|uniref:NAD(P)/FAD-dependent oxidoreductase n=1 Tax=Tissierella pigra TaxID=2607614 RepID=A0A6N7XFY5_9FIRM|nr:NAD(P)/FAD-dependent oxidoreductase [Tissierella pigra]MBU5425535.1 NAD(P)/FAD-dependent oxidoreductase [Tissierella pigra]MSU00909.1 NAD(P)/FAD-dependent oxidoreductase [Tissierella pigra]
MSNRIIVIGGGAAGMMAALAAKEHGSEVLILERNDRVGKKLLATGNGRCNYTNINLNINNYHGNNPKFSYVGLSEFNVDKTIEFFEKLGITPAIEENGKVFPLSFQASSVLDVLRYEIEDRGIELITEAQVSEIKRKNGFSVILKDKTTFIGDKVIIATGGMALPSSGSDGSGYTICKKLGHTITDIFPGLVQLKLESNFLRSLDGVKFFGIAGIYIDNKLVLEDKGDILFTSYGISGPPVLQLSRIALDYLNKGKNVELKVSIIHTKTEEELFEYLLNRFSFMPKKAIEAGLIGLINKRLIIPILKEINIDKEKVISSLSKEEIRKLTNILISWKFKVVGSQSWGNAQITAGGVNTDEVDNKTMESKIVKGIYIVGELLDIDGDCGGFNLQWAWSSGYIAGSNAARN